MSRSRTLRVIETAEPSFFDSLLERSEAFEEVIAACFPEADYVLAISNQKYELVATACTLCSKRPTKTHLGSASAVS